MASSGCSKNSALSGRNAGQGLVVNFFAVIPYKYKYRINYFIAVVTSFFRRIPKWWAMVEAIMLTVFQVILKREMGEGQRSFISIRSFSAQYPFEI